MACLLLVQGAPRAETLRISPEDLRLRVGVSLELSASFRQELKDLAKTVQMLPDQEELDSHSLLQERFASRELSEKNQLLAQYYFVVARLEQGLLFSEEFNRRDALLDKSLELIKQYRAKIDNLVDRAPYGRDLESALVQIQSFPLGYAEEKEDGSLHLLHQFPKPDIKLGRQVLQALRREAKLEQETLEAYQKKLHLAEKAFLAEVSHLNKKLTSLRPQIQPLVKVPGEGLPFSL